MKTILEKLKEMSTRQRMMLAMLAGCMLLTDAAFLLDSIVLVVIGLASAALAGAWIWRTWEE